MTTMVTYRNNDRQCFCQIKFDTGERVLVSIATAPTPSVKVLRLTLGGFLPRQTIWEYNPTMAGGYNAYVENMMRMFPPGGDEAANPLDVIRDTLLRCSSLEDARRTLLNCEAQASHSDKPAHVGSEEASTTVPQQPDWSKPFDGALLSFGNRLKREVGFGMCEGLGDAATLVLTSVGTGVLAESDHFPVPIASSVGTASIGACFIGACTIAVSKRLAAREVELNRDVFIRTGLAVFQMYPEQQRVEIVTTGGKLFDALVTEATTRTNLREWLVGVDLFTAAYVLTQDRSWIKLLARQYQTLAAARE